MSSICDADFHYLKPGKKVALKSFNGSKVAPADIAPAENYWRLVGAKAVTVKVAEDNLRVLLRFEQDLKALGLTSHSDEENSLWVLISDLKFVCRY
jgi:hypothetical protein